MHFYTGKRLGDRLATITVALLSNRLLRMLKFAADEYDFNHLVELKASKLFGVNNIASYGHFFPLVQFDPGGTYPSDFEKHIKNAQKYYNEVLIALSDIPGIITLTEGDVKYNRTTVPDITDSRLWGEIPLNRATISSVNLDKNKITSLTSSLTNQFNEIAKIARKGAQSNDPGTKAACRAMINAYSWEHARRISRIIRIPKGKAPTAIGDRPPPDTKWVQRRARQQLKAGNISKARQMALTNIVRIEGGLRDEAADVAFQREVGLDPGENLYGTVGPAKLVNSGYITVNNILTARGKLRNHKAAGMSGLREDHLFHTNTKDCNNAMAKCFSWLICLGAYPAAWKAGRLVFICKKDKVPSETSELRPITIPEALGKFFTRCILIKAGRTITDCIPNEQGVVDSFDGALTRGMETRRQALRMARNKKGCIASLDVKGAFDNVIRSAITRALAGTPLPQEIRDTLTESFTGDRVGYEDSHGTWKWYHPQRGVKQGCPASPVLFALALASVSRALNKTTNTMNHLVYAEDMVLFADTPEQLTERITLARSEMQKIGLSLNLEKSRCIDYSGTAPDTLANIPVVHPVDGKTDTIYLGIPIDDGGEAMAEKVDKTINVITKFWDTFNYHGATIMTVKSALPKLTYHMRAGIEGDWYAPVDEKVVHPKRARSKQQHVPP